MASNQVSNQRHSASGNQRSQATKRPSEDVGGDEEPDFGSLGNIADQASTYWAQGEDQVRECVRGREGAAMLTALAAGLGVGLVIGAALGRSHTQPRSLRDRLTAEGFGRRLMDRIESMIPDALAEHFGK